MSLWPRGEVIEVRRGGAGVLETLMTDAATTGHDGLLHLRHPNAGAAMLALRSGLVVGALASDEVDRVGPEALVVVRDLASDGATVVEVHRLPSSLVEELLAIHTGSRLRDTSIEEDTWWRGRMARPARRRGSRLPSMAPTIRAPEAVTSSVDQTRAKMVAKHVEVPPGAVRVVHCHDREPITAFAMAWARAGGRSIVVHRRDDVEVGLERRWLLDDRLTLPDDLDVGRPLLVVLDDVHLLPVLFEAQVAFDQIADLADHVRDVGGVLLVPLDSRLHSGEEALRIERLGASLDLNDLAALAADPPSLSALGAMDAGALMERHERLAAWRAASPDHMEAPLPEDEFPAPAEVVVEVVAPAQEAPQPVQEATVAPPVVPRRAQRARARRMAPRAPPALPRFSLPRGPMHETERPLEQARTRRQEADLVRNAQRVETSLPPPRRAARLGLASVRHLPELSAPRFKAGTDLRDVLRAAPVVEAMGRRQRSWSELRLRVPHSDEGPNPVNEHVPEQSAETTPAVVSDAAPVQRRRRSMEGSKRRRLGGDVDD